MYRFAIEKAEANRKTTYTVVRSAGNTKDPVSTHSTPISAVLALVARVAADSKSNPETAAKSGLTLATQALAKLGTPIEVETDRLKLEHVEKEKDELSNKVHLLQGRIAELERDRNNLVDGLKAGE